MSNVYAATEARENFFNILNRILYGRETIYIKKTGVDSIIKLELTTNSRKVLKSLAGSISKKDADLMKNAIKNSKKHSPRKIKAL